MNFRSKIRIILISVLCAAGAAAQAYGQGVFFDVQPGAWYAEDVDTAYQMRLMVGTSASRFSPDETLTVAEAVTLSSRIAAAYRGETIGEGEGGVWYEPYVRYASDTGILAKDMFDDYTRPVTRIETAVLLAKALPSAALPAVNAVAGIPDVTADMPYAQELLTLYRAGVMMGEDEYGNFRPFDSITRSEIASSICRAALPDRRLRKDLAVHSGDDAYDLILTSGFTGAKEGIASGWQLDNRGGVPRRTAL